MIDIEVQTPHGNEILQLGYNNNDNPYTVATQFVEEHNVYIEIMEVIELVGLHVCGWDCKDADEPTSYRPCSYYAEPKATEAERRSISNSSFPVFQYIVISSRRKN